MAGLLDDFNYFGDNAVKDQFGQTQADRREPLWSGLIQGGMGLLAGSQDISPTARAQAIMQAGQAYAGIPKAMMDQRSAAAQQTLQAQQVKAGQSKLDAQARLAALAKSPEFQAAVANLEPHEKILLQAALDAGDMTHATQILSGQGKMQRQLDQARLAQANLDLRRQAEERKKTESDLKLNKPVLKDGNYIFPNGDTYNDVSGWKIKDGKPVPFGQGHTIAPPPGGTAAPAATSSSTPTDPNEPPPAETGASPNAPYPSLVQQFPAPAGKDIAQEIANWSNMPANAGIPHGLKPSEYDDAPRNYAVLGTLPPHIAQQVQNLGDYKETLASAKERMQNADVMRYVKIYNPDFDQGKYKIVHDTQTQYIPGKPVGNQILAQGTAYEHLQSLWKQYSTLSDGAAGNNTPAARAILQSVQQRLGLPGAAGFQVAQTAVADEVAKAMRGPGVLNEAEQKVWDAKFDAAKSPAQMHAVILEALNLLEGKEKSIKQSFHDATGMQRKDFLSKDAKAFTEEMRQWKPPGAAAPTAGVVLVHPNGTEVTMDDVNETAKKNNTTAADVISQLGLKPKR